MDVTFIAVTPGDLVFQASDDAIRARCLSPFSGHPGGCPHFGKAWGCPPHAPSLAEFKARISSFPHLHFIVVTIDMVDRATGKQLPRAEVSGAFAAASEAVTAVADAVLDGVPGALVVNGEGCTRCTRLGLGACTCPASPCRLPGRLSYSLSVAFAVHETLARRGIDMDMARTGLVRRVALVATPVPVDLDATWAAVV